MRIDYVEMGEMRVDDMGKTDNEKGNEIANLENEFAHMTRQSLEL